MKKIEFRIESSGGTILRGGQNCSALNPAKNPNSAQISAAGSCVFRFSKYAIKEFLIFLIPPHSPTTTPEEGKKLYSDFEYIQFEYII